MAGTFVGTRNMRAVFLGLVSLLAVAALAPERASATTITLTNLGPVSPSNNGLLIASPGVTESLSNNAPQSTGANSSDLSGWDPWGSTDTNSQWLSVAGCCGLPDSFATFSFASPQTSFQMLWGSPNSNNTITFYSGTDLGGSVVGTVTFVDGSGYYVDGVLSSTAYGPNNTGPGDLISFDLSTAIESFILTSNVGGFEVADISIGDPTPLPPTWIAMLGGLACVGFFAYRGTRRPAGVTALGQG